MLLEFWVKNPAVFLITIIAVIVFFYLAGKALLGFKQVKNNREIKNQIKE